MKINTQPREHSILIMGGCADSPGVDDLEFWQECNDAMQGLGFNSADVECIWDICGMVIKLGNLSWIDAQVLCVCVCVFCFECAPFQSHTHIYTHIQENKK